MEHNYYLHEAGPQINSFLAATAWNFKEMMDILVKEIQNCFQNFQTKIFTNDSILRSDSYPKNPFYSNHFKSYDIKGEKREFTKTSVLNGISINSHINVEN